MCVCVCVCACVFVCVHVCVHVCLCVCVKPSSRAGLLNIIFCVFGIFKLKKMTLKMFISQQISDSIRLCLKSFKNSLYVTSSSYGGIVIYIYRYIYIWTNYWWLKTYWWPRRHKGLGKLWAYLLLKKGGGNDCFRLALLKLLTPEKLKGGM